MEDLVTVIMPVYNTEKYIEKAIESVEHQIYPNIELIIVDDCSPDNSYEIYSTAQKHYSNIRVIKHKSNKGLASSRNSGLQEAKGNWVCFLDSDDTLYPDTISSMLKFANDTVDVVLGSFNRNIDGVIRCEYVNRLSEGVYSKDKFVKMIFDTIPLNVISCIGTKIYRTEMIKKYDLKFETRYLYNEDLAFIIDVLMVIEKIAYIDKPVYEYFVRKKGSIQTSYRDHLLVNLYCTRKKLNSLFKQSGCLDEKLTDIDKMWFEQINAAFSQEFKYKNTVSETLSDIKLIRDVFDSEKNYKPVNKNEQILKKAILSDDSSALLVYLRRKQSINALKSRVKQIIKRT